MNPAKRTAARGNRPDSCTPGCFVGVYRGQLGASFGFIGGGGECPACGQAVTSCDALTRLPAAAATVSTAVESWLCRRRHAGRAFWRGRRQGDRYRRTAQRSGESVAPGKVVYSGSGLRGYGKLLIVKHAGEFLSAYAHNEIILVKGKGDNVSAGQKIALMATAMPIGLNCIFEIRRYGKPLDPLNYLPERS